MGTVAVVLYSWFGNSFPGRAEDKAVLQESFAAGETLRDLCNRLSGAYPQFGAIIFDDRAQRFYPHVVLIRNGNAAHAIRDLDGVLKDGDEILFVPFYAGG